MTLQLPVRRGTHVRRRRTVRRATPRISGLQIRALAAMVLCVLAGWALASGSFLPVRSLEIQGARFTSESAIEAASAIDTGTGSAFELQSDRIAAALVRLPAVAGAHVEVQLPSTLLVRLEEREPKVIWVIGDHRYVLDSYGMLFGEVDEAARPIASGAGPLPTPGPSQSPAEPILPASTPVPTPAPTASASRPPAGGPSLAPVPTALPTPSLAIPSVPERDPAAGLPLPVVVDRMAADANLKLGDYVDPTWLDAAYRVANLTPAEIGSTADRLVTTIDDRYGLTLAPAAGGWVADFGVYTLNLRKPDVVPLQVRALRSLFLASSIQGVAQPIEAHVAWVWLMGDVPGGTFSFLPK